MKDDAEIELKQLIDKYKQEIMERYVGPQEHMLQATPSVITEAAQSSDSEDLALPQSDTSFDNLTDIGYLQIRISTEDQAIPLEGAVVTVTHRQNGTDVLNRTLITDSSGLTPIIELPTKNRALSLTPNNTAPFEVYTVTVKANGYLPKQFLDLPIYGGVTAIQSVSMIPLPEAGDDDITLTYQESSPSL